MRLPFFRSLEMKLTLSPLAETLITHHIKHSLTLQNCINILIFKTSLDQKLLKTLEALWSFKQRPYALQHCVSCRLGDSSTLLKSARLSLQGCGDTNMGLTYLKECEIWHLLSYSQHVNEEVWSKHNNIFCFRIFWNLPQINGLILAWCNNSKIPQAVKIFSTF